MKVILFDVDGTLVRAGGAGKKALGMAARALYGRRDLLDGIDMAGRTDPWICRRILRKATGRGPSRAALAALRAAYLRRLPGQVRKAVAEGRYAVPPGLKALVRRLAREEGVLLGLGTGNFERGARIKLEPAGLNGYFRFGGFGCDAVSRAGILRKAVRRAVRLAGAGAKGGGARRHGRLEAFVVGDTPHDVSAGRAAGCATIAVCTGFSDRASLEAARPDRLAPDFRGLDEWLKWFGLGPGGSSPTSAPRR